MVPHPALAVIRRRCSTRSYTPEQVDAETIRSLIDAATRAPTAMHEEPWAFVVVQDIARLHRYSEATKAAWRGREIASALLGPGFNVFYGANTLIVICAKPAGPYAVADCWLAAENLMLAATARGIATYWGTCAKGAHAAVAELVGFETDTHIVGIFYLGYQADDVAVPERPAPVINRLD